MMTHQGFSLHGSACIPDDSSAASFAKVVARTDPKIKSVVEEDVHSPPLDSVTVTTTSETCDDNASSCSSLSCDVPELQSTKPRPIFGDYWTAQGLSTSPFHRAGPSWITAPPTSISFENGKVCGPVYANGDHLLVFQQQESEQRRPSCERRSIFSGGQVPSRDLKFLNELVQAPAPPTFKKSVAQSDLQLLADLALLNTPAPVRKAKSAPALTRKSALRPSRFSGNGRASSDLKRSVSFRDHVEVTVISSSQSPLVERWAEKGWMEWFA